MVGQYGQAYDNWSATDHMERLYQRRPYMQEGMYVVGVRPKSLGEGVVVIVYTSSYLKAWTYWDHNFERDLAIYQWSRGGFTCVGRRMRAKDGRIFYAPIPPPHIVKTA